jgi:hypothetical protein
MEQDIVMMETGKFWMLVGFLTAIAGVCFYLGFSYLRRARIIEDTPTAKIRSAAQGFVELNGQAVSHPEKPVVSRLTDTPCCWYRFEIEKKGDKNWHTVEKGSSEDPFIVEDETGRCIILPKGAEVTATERSVWYGKTHEPQDRNPASERITMSVGGLNVKIDNGLSRSSGGFSFSNYRYTEERIYAGDTLYALGHFRSLDEKDHHRAKAQITSELLKFWKQDQQRMLQRFDEDGNGLIDEAEWEKARDTASQIAREKHARIRETQVMHILSKSPVKGYPFLLSSLPEFNLVSRYRNWSRVLLVLSLAGSFGVFYLLTSRF